MRTFFYRFISNFPFGVFIGVEATLLFVWALSLPGAEHLSLIPAYIFVSATTLLASSVAIAGVLTTLQQNEENRRLERARKLSSARAFLPPALSNFCGIAQNGVRRLRTVYEAQNRRNALNNAELELSRLSLPDEVVTVFRDILEYTDDEGVSKRVQMLLREYQIQYARVQSLIRDANVSQDSYLRQLVVGWAYLYAITGTLFEYSRNEHHTVNDDDFSVGSAMRLIGVINDDHYSEEIGLYDRTFDRRR